MRYHTIIKNHAKEVVRYAYQYPKLLLFAITIILAYLLFQGGSYGPMNSFILSLGYFGTFIAGILFVYGFTAAPATAVFLIFGQEQSILIAAIIGGFGALIGDLFIFSLIRHSFTDELDKLSKEKVVLRLKEHVLLLFKNNFKLRAPSLIKEYIMPVFAGFIIASPLPDEIGVSLLAASSSISIKVFSVISYVLNTIGILVILGIGSLI